MQKIYAQYFLEKTILWPVLGQRYAYD